MVAHVFPTNERFNSRRGRNGKGLPFPHRAGWPAGRTCAGRRRPGASNGARAGKAVDEPKVVQNSSPVERSVHARAARSLGCADMPRRSNVANWVENLACRPAGIRRPRRMRMGAAGARPRGPLLAIDPNGRRNRPLASATPCRRLPPAPTPAPAEGGPAGIMVAALPWRVRGVAEVAGLHRRAMPAPPRFARTCLPEGSQSR